jgi:hypothetical protein
MTTQPDRVALIALSTAPTTIAAAVDNSAPLGVEPAILDGDATSAYVQSGN